MARRAVHCRQPRPHLGLGEDRKRLVAHGVEATPPFDHGFALLTAFRDPDGNNIQIMTLAGG